MSTQGEIDRITTNIANAYTAVSNLGGTLPSTQNSANLSTAISSIPSGGGPVNIEDGSGTGSVQVVGCDAGGNYSVAEGEGTETNGEASHAEGYQTLAYGFASHAEGETTTAAGSDSHAEGFGTYAGFMAHAEGYYSRAESSYQHAQGKCNIADNADTYAHIVGNGASANSRSNAHTLDWNGNAWFAGDVYVGSTGGTNKDNGSKKLAVEVPVTASDNGKFMQVVNGAWAAVTVPNANGVSF